MGDNDNVSVGSSAVTNGPLGVGGKLITVEVIICRGRGHMGGFPGSSAGKESTCNAGDPWVRSLGRSPGGGHGSPLQYSCLENPYRQRSLVGYSLWSCQELDKTKHSTAQRAYGNSVPSAQFCCEPKTALKTVCLKIKIPGDLSVFSG